MLLEINNQTVDLPATTRGLIRLNKSVAAVSELETRSGEYSWQFVLPPTRRNAQVFGPLLHAQTLDKFTRALLPFRLTAGGQEWRGLFRLTSLKDGYAGSLTTEALGWAAGLGDKTLNDLQTLAPVAFNGSLAALNATLTKTCDETDLQFPLCAYGNFFYPATIANPGTDEEEEIPAAANTRIEHPLSADDYAPSVYYLNVLQAIFREAGGYYLAGPVLSEASVRRWCITAAGSSGSFWPWGSLLPARSVRTSPLTHTSNHQGTNFTNTAFGFEDFEPHGDMAFFAVSVPVHQSGGTRALDGAAARYVARQAGAYGFAWQAVISTASQNIHVVDSQGAAQIKVAALALLVSRQGEGLAGASAGLGNRPPVLAPLQQRLYSVQRLDNPTTFALAQGSFGATVASVYLDPGDTVQLVLLARRTVKDADGDLEAERRALSVTFASAFLECISFDGPTTLSPAAVLPPLSQKELVRDFLLRTNTVPVTDPARRTVHLLSRAAHTAAQGPSLDLDGVCDPTTAEYSQVLPGAYRVVFQPAASEDTPASLDAVPVPLAGRGISGEEKVLGSPFAAVATDTYFTPDGLLLSLPVLATADELATPRSEAAQTVSGKAPRVVEYSAPDLTGAQIPYLDGALRPGRGAYVGTPLAWDGEQGAVTRHYRGFLASVQRGHLCRIQAALSPELYQQCKPGRRVYLAGAEYTLEKVEGWDPSQPAADATLELLRLV